MRTNSVLGIDLGTSSVKVLQRYADGSVARIRAGYGELGPQGWWQAVKAALAQADLETVEAVGLSSQVGTYVVDEDVVIGWSSGIGAKELSGIKDAYDAPSGHRVLSDPAIKIYRGEVPRRREGMPAQGSDLRKTDREFCDGSLFMEGTCESKDEGIQPQVSGRDRFSGK